MSVVLTGLALLATIGSALMAGTFFAFSSFVMGALGRLPPEEGIAAMQSINVVVLNRSFLGTFIGTAVVSVVLGVAAVMAWSDPRAPWFLAGALLYVIGTFAVTAAGNVPLNDRLAAVTTVDSVARELWSHYLVRWTQLNTVRTVAPALGVLCFCIGFTRSEFPLG